MSKSKGKTKQVNDDVLQRWLRTELESFHTAYGWDRYLGVDDLSRGLGMSPTSTEELLRSMPDVRVTPPDEIRKTTGQADFPKTHRKKGTPDAGYWPGVKLETAGERAARATRQALIARATEAVQGAVAHLGLSARFISPGVFELTSCEPEGDALAAVTLALAGDQEVAA